MRQSDDGLFQDMPGTTVSMSYPGCTGE
jgi:hypothetical protein